MGASARTHHRMEFRSHFGHPTVLDPCEPQRVPLGGPALQGPCDGLHGVALKSHACQIARLGEVFRLTSPTWATWHA